MKRINEYQVEIHKYGGNNTFEQKWFNVLLENNDYIIIDEVNFTRIRKHARGTSELDPVIGRSSVYERNWGITSLDGIVFHLYSEAKVKNETIKRQIAEFIDKKYGWLHGIDLSFICFEG